MARERLVVVGGDAAGMSAASQARRARTAEDLEIVAFERSEFTSYSACGIPYWVAGEVGEREELIARTPEEHRARGIDLRTGTEVVEVDVAGRRVRARDLASGTESWTGWDRLVLATGARPIRPDLPGIDAPNVHGVQTLADGGALLDTLTRLDPPAGRRAVVVGAGYIGVEMAEALSTRGFAVTVLHRGPQPMATLDPDMGALVHTAMNGMGIETVAGAEVVEVLLDDAGRARGARCADGSEYPADLVVLGIGVAPRTELAKAAGLPLGASGGLLTDASMRVRGQERIWAGGDCVEVWDRVAERTRHIPLGTHANKQGQVIGTNVTGGAATFPGVVGTAITKVCALEIGRTGLLEREARELGLDFASVVIESTTTAGYYPTAAPMTVKMLAERGTGRLLGTQIVGRGPGSAKRVDVAAVALTAGLTAADVVSLDLGYAPPFSPVWDPVQVAARKAVAATR
ncbi:FAD-dependent oxidoreductase [Streptomyces sp. BI20]|uniref:FAD-dependent oxidoreductase n=1 Tax=Streptomyces sp. BI20 TaxID=3403460 RepID=UPI003C770F6F